MKMNNIGKLTQNQMKRITKQPQEKGSEKWQNVGIISNILTWNMLFFGTSNNVKSYNMTTPLVAFANNL